MHEPIKMEGRKSEVTIGKEAIKDKFVVGGKKIKNRG